MSKIRKEWYKKHRPKELNQVYGQEAALSGLDKMITRAQIPHAVLLTGPSGVGKTTIGRILKRHLNCGDEDWVEINAADFKGIETVREIRRNINLAPLAGDVRIWFIDECGKLTNDAQNSLLKLLEDTPDHVYFMLATTDPHKLLKTVLTRCTEIRLVPLSPAHLRKVLDKVVEKENVTTTDEVLEEIVEASDGSARKALVILEQVAQLDTPKEQMAAVSAASLNKADAILLARALCGRRSNWSEVAALLKKNEDEPETVRHLVLAYARSILLGTNPAMCKHAWMVIDIFSKNFYDSKKAGLAAACYEIMERP